VLASVFSRYGGYETPNTYVDGLVPAVWVGAAVVAAGAAAALLMPRRKRGTEVVSARSQTQAVQEAA
jgi:cytochrome c biogenesis factor